MAKYKTPKKDYFRLHHVRPRFKNNIERVLLFVASEIDGLKPQSKAVFDEALNRAEAVMKNAYNLYSHFYVGAAVLTKKGNIYVGTFAENSSQGLTICAEPAAILAANTAGERLYKAIAVIGGGEKFDSERPITPCGRCRQFIYDFSQISRLDIEILCSNTKKDRVLVTSIEELLPVHFGPSDVGLDLDRFRH